MTMESFPQAEPAVMTPEERLIEKERRKTLAEANKEAKRRVKSGEVITKAELKRREQELTRQFSYINKNWYETGRSENDSTEVLDERTRIRRKIRSWRPYSGIDVLHEKALEENKQRNLEMAEKKKQEQDASALAEKTLKEQREKDALEQKRLEEEKKPWSRFKRFLGI